MARSILGIDLIPAYSPEARGRSERLFGTLQGRLPQELALHQITTMEAANVYLKEHFIPAFNERFGIKPEESQSAFVPYLGAPESLKEILCLHHQRQVNRDNTVSVKKLNLQLPVNPERRSYFKTSVRIHEYSDGSLSVFHGPRRLADYDSDGVVKTSKATKQTA